MTRCSGPALALLLLLASGTASAAALRVQSLGAWTLWQEADRSCTAVTRHSDGLVLRVTAAGPDRSLTLEGGRWTLPAPPADLSLAVDSSLPWRLAARPGAGDRLTVELSDAPELVALLQQGSELALLAEGRAVLLDLAEIAPAWRALEVCAGSRTGS